jgi:hypothetical protein
MFRSILARIAIACSMMPLVVPLAQAQQAIPPSMPIQQQAALVWREMRDCAQIAAKQQPDHTPEGNAKREATRLDCLRRNHLPVTPTPNRY